jgi:F-type H+-transporting ATPase subunit epsilon
MQLEIITPDKTIFKGEVDSATFPGTKGSFQVLKNHAPIISTLDQGMVKYKINGEQHEVMVSGGIVEVLDNQIILLAEGILKAEVE